MKRTLALVVVLVAITGILWRAGVDSKKLTGSALSSGPSNHELLPSTESGEIRSPLNFSSDTKGRLYLTSWPDYSPIQNKKIFLQHDSGNVEEFTSDLNGGISLNPGVWAIVRFSDVYYFEIDRFVISSGQSLSLIGFDLPPENRATQSCAFRSKWRPERCARNATPKSRLSGSWMS